MDLKGKKLVLVGGAGLIGSHTVDHLLAEDVREILIYDNFVRGRVENLTSALTDPRVKIFDVGGDVMQTDILEAAFERADGVFISPPCGCCNATNTPAVHSTSISAAHSTSLKPASSRGLNDLCIPRRHRSTATP